MYLVAMVEKCLEFGGGERLVLTLLGKRNENDKQEDG